MYRLDEHFNKLIKSLLGKVVLKPQKEQELSIALPLVCMLRSATGLNQPFEFLYRKVWGPVDILKENFESTSMEYAASLVLNIEKRMEQMTELVSRNQTRTQHVHKC